jgi:hypothetical protein
MITQQVNLFVAYHPMPNHNYDNWVPPDSGRLLSTLNKPGLSRPGFMLLINDVCSNPLSIGENMHWKQYAFFIYPQLGLHELPN